MSLSHKTKIVATIGPACEDEATLAAMIEAGMNVARLNFSHGEFAYHGEMISRLRGVAARLGREVCIMADLPGLKIRVGEIEGDRVELHQGEQIVLTARPQLGNRERVSISRPELAALARPGEVIFLSDGFLRLEVEESDGLDLRCRIVVGGELRSRKGVNLPGLDLGIAAFTDRDRECLRFALDRGVDAVSQSFVAAASDVLLLRDWARGLGHDPFVVAKIERRVALGQLDAILEAADGIMLARGDLGVEIDLADMAMVQKNVVSQANRLGRPVIIATEMLESMTSRRRPTRAEATDVANAILDGGDCVMLSAESAVGRYPVEAVAMLAAIARSTEPTMPECPLRRQFLEHATMVRGPVDLIALAVDEVVRRGKVAMLLVPTQSGATARNLARFRHENVVFAISPLLSTCRHLAFSWGVVALHKPEMFDDAVAHARGLRKRFALPGRVAVLVEGPSPRHPQANHRLELLDLRKVRAGEAG